MLVFCEGFQAIVSTPSFSDKIPSWHMESYYGLNSVTVCPADLTQVLFKTWSCDSAISPLCEELFWCASKRAKVLAGPFFFFFWRRPLCCLPGFSETIYWHVTLTLRCVKSCTLRWAGNPQERCREPCTAFEGWKLTIFSSVPQAWWWFGYEEAYSECQIVLVEFP